MSKWHDDEHRKNGYLLRRLQRSERGATCFRHG